jgi:hypothetical protein
MHLMKNSVLCLLALYLTNPRDGDKESIKKTIMYLCSILRETSYLITYPDWVLILMGGNLENSSLFEAAISVAVEEIKISREGKMFLESVEKYKNLGGVKNGRKF